MSVPHGADESSAGPLWTPVRIRAFVRDSGLGLPHRKRQMRTRTLYRLADGRRSIAATMTAAKITARMNPTSSE